jgi:hypothetical protein
MSDGRESYQHGTLKKTPQHGEINWKEETPKYKQRCRVCGARLKKTPHYNEIEPYACCSNEECGTVCFRKLTEEE